MSDTRTHEASFSVGAYFVTFLVLGVLLVLTILAARLHMGGISTLISLVIAAIKAVIVAVVFMHLRLASKSTWVFAGAGLLWLAILFTFTASDYLSRSWYTNPPPAPVAWTLTPEGSSNAAHSAEPERWIAVPPKSEIGGR